MSSIDERVVKMEFDNAKFESGVKESLNTIENLTVSLNKMDKTNVSFDQIQRAANNFNVDNILNSVEQLNQRFSTMGIVGGTAIAKITNSAMNFVTSGLKSLTSGITQAWDTINTGGMQRAKNIENAKFQIEGLGRKWEEVSKSINDAVEDTAYGLDEAALAASQFLASGVKTGDKMTTALRSISGVAAMTNSGYSDIARIMTTIAGNGKVMTMQLNQLGMKGINAAATVRDYFNSSSENLAKFTKLYNEYKKKNQASMAPGAQATEQAVREMVTNGAIDFETFTAAMDSAYGEHAKDAQRTFEGASANVQAALKKIGAEFKSVTISSEDYDKTLDSNKNVDFTKTTFNQINVLNELRNVLKGLQADMKTAGFVELFSDIYHSVSRGMSFFLNSLYVTDDTGKHLIPQLAEALNNLKGAFENVAGFVVGIASAFSSAWKAVFPQSLPDMILNITSRIKDFTDMLPRVDDIFGAISDIFGLSGDVADETSDSLDNLQESYNGVTGSLRELVAQTINGDFGNGADRIDALGDSYQQIQDAVNSCYDDQWRLHEDWINNIDTTIQVGAKLAKTEEDIAEKEKESADIAERSEEAYNGMMTALEDTVPVVKNYAGAFEGLKGILMGFFAIVSIVKNIIVTLVLVIRKFVFPVIFRIGEVILEIVGTIGSFIAALNSLLPTTRQTGEALDFIAEILRPLWNLFHWVTQGIIDFMRAIRPENDPLGHLREYISNFIDSVTNLGGQMGPILDKVKDFALGIAEKLGGIELPNGKRLSDVFSAVFDPIINTMKNVADRIKRIKFPDGSTLYSKLKGSFGGIPDYLQGLSAKIQNRASGIFSFFSTMKERISEAIHADGTSIPSRLEYVFEPVLYTFRRIRDKLTNVFAPLLEFLSPITSALGNLMSKIVDGLKGLINGIANKLASLPDMTKDLKKKFQPIIDFLRPIATAIKNTLSGIVENLGSFINDIADSIDLSKNPFEIIIDVLKSFGQGISDTFHSIANSQIVTAIKGFVTTVIGGLSTGVQSLVSGIQRVFAPVIEALQALFGNNAITAYADGFGNNMEEFGDNLDQANDSIADPGNAFLSTLESFAGKLTTIVPAFAQSILAFLTVYNLGVRLPRDISKLMRSLTGGVDSFTGFFGQLTKSLKKVTKAVEFSILAEGFKSLAISLAILAGVVIIFGNIDWKVIETGLAAIAILGTMLVGFTALLGLLAKFTNLNTFGSGILKIAGACLVFIITLSGIMHMLGAKTEVVNGETVTVYKNLQNVLVSIGMLSLIIAAILVPITAAVAIAGKLGGSFAELGQAFIGIGVGLLAIEIAIGRMHDKLKEVSESNTWDILFMAIGVLVGVSAALMFVQKKLAGTDVEAQKAGLGFLMMTVGLMAIAYAIQMLSDIDYAQIESATLALVTILGILAGMIYLIGNYEADMKSAGEGILKMAVAVALLAVSIMLISTLGENIDSAVISLSFIMVMLMGLAEICANAKSSLTSGGTGLLLMAAAIGVLAVALFYLQDIAQGEKLDLMIKILAAVTVALAALAAICAQAKSKMTTGAAAIIMIALAISVLIAALGYFAKDVDVGAIVAITLSLLFFMAAIGALGFLASKFEAGFVTLGAVLSILAAVVLSLAIALLAGGLAFSMISAAILAFSDANVDMIGIAGGLAVLGLALIPLAAGAALLGVSMIALGAGALVAALGIGALASSMMAVVVVIYAVAALFQMAGQAIMDGLLGGIVSGIGGVLGAIGGVANTLIGGFCSILGIHSPSTKFMEFGKNILAGLKGGMSGGEALGQDFGALVSGGAMEGLTEGFGDFDLTSMLGDNFDMSNIGDMLGGGDWMSKLGGGMSSSNEPVEVSAEKVQEAAASADEATEAFKGVGEHAIQWFAMGMRDFDSSAYYNAFTGENGLAAQMEQAIDEIQFDASGFYNAGVASMGSFMEGVDTRIEEVKSRINTLFEGAAANVTLPDLAAKAKEMAAGFVRGLNTQIEGARTAGRALGQAVHDAADVDLWWTGYWMANGFCDGINSMQGAARAAGSALGMAAKAGAQAALDINSPSKEMIKVGRWAGEGFVIGIDSEQKNAERAGTRMANVLLDSVSMIPDLFDLDPNLEPTITPVLDMSNINEGLASINDNPVFNMGQIDGYFAIADAANKTASSIVEGNSNYQINIELNWEAGEDANDKLDELAQKIDARLRMEG